MVIYDVVWDVNPRIRRFKAAEDIEAGEAVYLSGTEEVSLTTNASCAGKAFAGVAVKSAPSGQYISVAVPPTEVEVKASGTINAGSYVVPTANGAVKALQSETKATIAGYAITPASDNKVRIKLMDNYTPPQGEGLNAKGSYSVIVLKDDSTVWAEDKYGRTIAEGEAGVDDASVIQSALNVGKVIYIGEGLYIINSQISVPDGVILIGAGNKSTTLKVDTSNPPSPSVLSGTFSYPSYTILKDFGIEQTEPILGSLVGIAIEGSYVKLENLYLYGLQTHAIEVKKFVNVILTDCDLRKSRSDSGLYAHRESISNDAANVLIFRGGGINANTRGIHLKNVDNVQFYGTRIELNTNEGVYIAGGGVIKFSNTWFESNGTHIKTTEGTINIENSTNVDFLTIDQSNFINAASKDFELDYINNLIFENIYSNKAVTFGSNIKNVKLINTRITELMSITSSGWDVDPTNLENAIDGDVSTTTGWASKTTSAAGTLGYITVDLGLSYNGVVGVKYGSYSSANNFVNLYVGWSDDGVTWKENYDYSTRSRSTSEVVSNAIAYVDGKHVRLRFYGAAADTYYVRIYEISLL